MRGIALCLFLLSAGCLSAQSFGSLYQDLDELDQTIQLIEDSTNRRLQMYEDLRRQLANSEGQRLISEQQISDLESISETQGTYVNNLLQTINQQELIRQQQLKYQKGLEVQLKLWKAGTVVVGITAVGLLVWKLID
jgi:hypothetical protein